jgi:hydroxyethylthiazole kinase-like sugar kinase family protein
VTFTVTGPTTFTYTGTDTLVAANGNEVFSTLTGSGTFTSTTTTQSSQVNTITGGTGRYADASGTFTETISSVVVSVTATSETTDNAAIFNGQISYQA